MSPNNRKATFHISLPRGWLIGDFQDFKRIWINLGKAQLHVNHPRTEFQIILATLQFSVRWSTVSSSSSSKHMGHAFTKIFPLRLRLSMLRIFFCMASHPKMTTLGVAFIFKKEATEFLDFSCVEVTHVTPIPPTRYSVTCDNGSLSAVIWICQQIMLTEAITSATKYPNRDIPLSLSQACTQLWHHTPKKRHHTENVEKKLPS